VSFNDLPGKLKADLTDIPTTSSGYVYILLSLLVLPPPVSKNAKILITQKELPTTVMSACMLCVPVLLLPLLPFQLDPGFLSPVWYVIGVVTAGVSFAGMASSSSISQEAIPATIVLSWIGGWLEEEWLITRALVEAGIAVGLLGGL